MKLTVSALLAIGCLASLTVRAQSTEATPTSAAAPTPAPSSPRVESAAIEEIVETVDGGYRFNAYIVPWHGARILVPDPLSQGHLAVGDSVRFLVMHQDIQDRKLLMLMSAERTAAAGAAPQVLPTVNSSTASATVEEVLRAED